jgi:hypothetical protein
MFIISIIQRVHMKGYSLTGGVIVINRDFTELDRFVKDFLDIISKHCRHLIVSGFVSISSGRTRGTEDVDVLIPKLPAPLFQKLFDDLLEKGFWCYQGDTADGVYTYIQDLSSIRFARVNEMFPNMEVIPVTEDRKAKFFELMNPQKMKIGSLECNIPPIEFEILYKELILAGKKDMDDALHLRNFYKDILHTEKFKEFEPIIKTEL